MVEHLWRILKNPCSSLVLCCRASMTGAWWIVTTPYSGRWRCPWVGVWVAADYEENIMRFSSAIETEPRIANIMERKRRNLTIGSIRAYRPSLVRPSHSLPPRRKEERLLFFLLLLFLFAYFFLSLSFFGSFLYMCECFPLPPLSLCYSFSLFCVEWDQSCE